MTIHEDDEHLNNSQDRQTRNREYTARILGVGFSSRSASHTLVLYFILTQRSAWQSHLKYQKVKIFVHQLWRRTFPNPMQELPDLWSENKIAICCAWNSVLYLPCLCSFKTVDTFNFFTLVSLGTLSVLKFYSIMFF